jgi:hypothetical protein
MPQITEKHKEFKAEDIKSVSRTATNPLFRPKYGVSHPYTTGFDVVVTTAPVEPVEFDDIHVPITYVNRSVDNTAYFSCISAKSGSYDSTDPLTIPYWSFVNSNYGESETVFKVDNTSSTEFDIIALNREWYTDSIDLDFFAVDVFTNVSATPISLFASKTSITTNLGVMHTLYTTGTSSYDGATDTLTMVDRLSLPTTNPYGAVFPKLGIILIFKDKLKATYVNFNNVVTTYLKSIAGRGIIFFDSNIYFARMYNDEFNASNNPTYTTEGGSVIKAEFQQDPITVVTTIGLYNENGELIATGRLNSPVIKRPDNEVIFRVETSH